MKRWLEGLLVIAIAAKLALMAFYAQKMQWGMDEFAHGILARFVEQGLYSHVDPVKTALPYLAYYAAVRASNTATTVLTLLRAETFVAALLVLVATFVAAQRLYRSRTLTLLALFALLSFSNFIENAFRVRNDAFATQFGVFALAVLLGKREGEGRLASYGAGALAGAAFLCTQKAIYLVVPLGLAALVLGWYEKRLVMRGARFTAGVAGVILLYGLGFGGLNVASVLSSVFFAPYLKMSDHLLVGNLWPELPGFITQTLERNIVPYLASALGIVAIFVTPSRKSGPHVALGVAAVLVTTFVFRHPQPWPYVFATCMPFLALALPAGITALPTRFQLVAVAGLSAVLCISFARNVFACSQRNDDQFQVVAAAEKMLGSRDHYVDGVGMIATRPIAGSGFWWGWDAPTLVHLRAQLTEGQSAPLEEMLRQQPKLWLLDYRTLGFHEFTAQVFELATVRVDELIFVSGRELGVGKTVFFRNLWTGPYRLIEGDGRTSPAELRVDGAPCGRPCRIAVGRHQVSSNAPVRTFLIPADVNPPGALPVRSGPHDLFKEVYSF
jgi:hypothetical protein